METLHLSRELPVFFALPLKPALGLDGAKEPLQAQISESLGFSDVRLLGVGAFSLYGSGFRVLGFGLGLGLAPMGVRMVSQ